MLLGSSHVVPGGCKFGKSSKAPDDGHSMELPPAIDTHSQPPGMVYIPPGTFHMGPA